MNKNMTSMFDGLDDNDKQLAASAEAQGTEGLCPGGDCPGGTEGLCAGREGDCTGSGDGEERPSPRLRRPDRLQLRLEPWSLDERLPQDHAARTVWAVVERLDLSRFYQTIAARGESPGRAATDPRLLISLWLFAAVEGVGNGRRLSRLCEVHDAYRWLCGGVSLNYHTLNDFRVAHEAALDDLLTQLLATLMSQNLVQVQRISQDGTKVRASAGRGSFRRRRRLQVFLEQARCHVAGLKKQADDEAGESARRRSAQQRAAAERQQRVEAALQAMSELEAVKAAQRKEKQADQKAPRASTTDPQARIMRLGDGSFAPAYNIQLATDTESRAIVAVEVTNHGTDHGEEQPLRQQVEERTGQKVREHLLDGGYVKLESIERAAAAGTDIFAPLPASGTGGSVCIESADDSAAVAQWRLRMRSAEGQAAYRERAATSETVNADLKTFRGLGPLAVRGLNKVRCVALWSVLAYNLLHFGQALLEAGCTT
jgi:transposase